MKALVGAFNQEKALVWAFSVIVQPVVEPMDRFAALLISNQQPESRVQRIPGTMLLSAQPISRLPLAPVSGSILTMSHNGQCPVCQCCRCVSSVISQLDRIKMENPSWAHSTDTGLLPGTAGLAALFLGFMG